MQTLSLALLIAAHGSMTTYVRPNIDLAGSEILSANTAVLHAKQTTLGGDGIIGDTFNQYEYTGSTPGNVQTLDGWSDSQGWHAYQNVHHEVYVYIRNLPTDPNDLLGQSQIPMQNVSGIKPLEGVDSNMRQDAQSYIGVSTVAELRDSDSIPWKAFVWLGSGSSFPTLKLTYIVKTTFTYGPNGSNGTHLAIRNADVPIAVASSPIIKISSVDSRVIYGKADKYGTVEADPNQSGSYVTFHPWTYKGGLYVGNAAYPDKSGEARVQLNMRPASTEGYEIGGQTYQLGTNSQQLLSGILLFCLGRGPDSDNATLTSYSAYSSVQDVRDLDWGSKLSFTQETSSSSHDNSWLDDDDFEGLRYISPTSPVMQAAGPQGENRTKYWTTSRTFMDGTPHQFLEPTHTVIALKQSLEFPVSWFYFAGPDFTHPSAGQQGSVGLTSTKPRYIYFGRWDNGPGYDNTIAADWQAIKLDTADYSRCWWQKCP